MRILAALLFLVLSACARPIPEGVTELTYATPYPPTHPFSRADQRWINFVEEQSAGRIVIRPVWSGALLSADMSMVELRHGVSDIGLITPIYVRGGTHLLRTQTGFYSGADSIESQVALYRCLERRVPQISRELAGLKVLAVQGGLLPGIITRSRPVENLDDLRGMRIRAPTELLAVLRSLGADPVDMPMGETYSALAKGVLDGVVAPLDTLRSLHFAEVADHYFELKIPRGAYPARAMDLDAWNELAPWQQELLDRSTSVWEAALADEIRRSESEGRAEGEGQISYLPVREREQERFDALYLREGAANARALTKFGIDGVDAYRMARNSLVQRDQVHCGDSS